jgi:hypothetical protein
MRVLIAVLAFIGSLLTAPSAPALSTAYFTRQVYSWQWADGSTASERTFTSAEYSSRVRDIAVLAQVRPAWPRHKVKLQVFQNGAWQTHTWKRTNARTGRVRLQLNPICQSGNWCKGTYDLRLKILKKGRQNPATLSLTVTFDSGSNTSPIVPPPSKPRVESGLAGPLAFQMAQNQILGPPAITLATALQNPSKRSEIVIDLMWNAPESYADNPVAGYYVIMTDNATLDSGQPAWYVEYAADQRDARIRGPIIYAQNPPQEVLLTVVAVDSNGELGEPAATVTLLIGCDAYGPDTGPANPYRTLCEHPL